MRLAIHLPNVDFQPEDGRAAAQRLESAAQALGWPVRLCQLSCEIEDFAPDLVLALDPFSSKLTAHPWVGRLDLPPQHFRWDWPRLSRLLSFDGWITTSAECAEFLDDILAPTAKRAPVACLPSQCGAVNVIALLPDLLTRAREAGGFIRPAEGNAPLVGVDYVVRVGGRDSRFVRRCFSSLAAQTTGGIGLVVVRYGAVDGLDEALSDTADHLRRVALVNVLAGEPRSTALWAGIDAVEAPFFGMLDDDDALHPNHVATLLPILRDRGASLAYSGAIRVLESPESLGRSKTSDVENRTLFGLEPPRLDRLATWRLQIHSSAFIARTELRPAIGPDPRLHFAEDTFLIRRLARTGAIVPSWRLTTDFFWRETRDDNTAFDPSHRERALLRIADRERLDPVMARMRGSSDPASTDDHQEPVTFWGDLSNGGASRWPVILTPADIQALPGGVPLFVCGTGTGARIVRGEIEKFDHLSITAFLDSFRTGNFGSYPVIAPADVPQADRSRAVLVIASQHVHEIAARLVPLGFCDIRNASPYIRGYMDLCRQPEP
ncbi:glycosyltransferase family 2 protein [Azospirillum argentinense]